MTLEGNNKLIKKKHNLYKNYYSEETKKLVEERFGKDLIMFNYSF